MAPKKGTPADSASKKRTQRKKNPTERPTRQRVLVVTPSGKKKLAWRPW